MATFTLEQGPTSVGAQYKTVGTLVLDSSYPTGGEALTAAQLGLQSVDEAHAEIVAVSGTTNVANATYDKTNSKVKVFDETPAEVGNTNSLENVKVQITAFGKAKAK
jgi:hypothetical protein